ncbi:MAG TPA: MarR family winged helix-turn-helix transcriptional regulator [Edaphobacter sp.]|nr:MarR family winged helix-turn-helix transcriptional regulator [Edaphobacter sp.]
MANPTDREMDSADYQALAEFRYQIRRFMRFSEEAARSAGVEPQQHQFLLALKGLPEDSAGSIGDVAERLQIQHHSAVELADRLVEQGLIQRRRASDDRRRVLLSLTSRGEKILRELTAHHRDELQASGPELLSVLRRIVGKAPARVSEGSDARKVLPDRTTAASRPRTRVRP